MTLPNSRERDEDRIVAILGELLERPSDFNDPTRRALEEELLRVVDRNFREVLKPFLGAKFGGMMETDGAARYTSMIGDFFRKILERRPDSFWKARSASELRRVASRALTNQLIDYLRAGKRDAAAFGLIARYAEERSEKFQEKTGMTFDLSVLGVIREWSDSHDPGRRVRGQILRHRHVDDMPWHAIADQLDLTSAEVRDGYALAIEDLRRLMS